MKINEARDVLRVALEGGPWPVGEVTDLICYATGCDPRTLRRAVREMRDSGELTTLRRTYWLSSVKDKGQLSFYLDGFPREQLIRHLSCRQEPSAAASDCAAEAHLDEMCDLMGAESRYEPYEGV